METQFAEQSIHAVELPLSKIFSDDYSFRIPPYQRPYSWTEEEAGELFDDLVGALDSADIPQAPYFLGSIVLIKGRASPRADVVDGQQRLTTLTILLCALRELSDEEQQIEQLDAFIHDKGNVFLGNSDSYRLTTRDRDNAFFRDFVQRRGGLGALSGVQPSTLNDSRLNFRNNAELFTTRLRQMDAGTRVRLAKYILTECYLVVVSAADSNAAYRIFAVMNDRGLDLSPTDILKAEIIGAIPEGDRADYTSKWEEIEETLGRDDFSNLFQHIRMIYRKAKPKAALVQEFNQYVRPTLDPKRFMDRTLDPLSSAFETILRANYSDSQYGDEINFLLRSLGRVDNSDWVAPLILFFSSHKFMTLEILRFLRDFERLVYGLFILRTYVNNRIARFAQVQDAIERKQDLFCEESPLQLDDGERAEIVKTLNDDLYSNVKTRLPVLLRLDAALSDKGVQHEPAVITVEHVLPQNPPSKSSWISDFPKESERERLTNKIGNLVLLSRSKNSKAQNFDFDRKKKEYFCNPVSTFALTNQVIMNTAWTPQTILNRQRELMGTLKALWRL